ncbi:MAG: hypothetical protein IT348_18055 [Candidatus Eisenbacteria bacterium]|nr:hypothetical protein [Candidatus Eisenbacteria bacterium]
MPTKTSNYTDASQAVQAHLGIMQNVIQRMASNSTSCKAWCIALVSGLLVVVADKGKPEYAWLAAMPTALFLVLDAYYLALERAFRASYNRFIDKLHHGRVAAADLYAVEPVGSLPRLFLGALVSFSVWPLYLTLLAMIWLAKQFVL